MSSSDNTLATPKARIRSVVPQPARPSIQDLIARLRVELRVVQEAIQALEGTAPESLPERARRLSRPGLYAAPMPERGKVIGIDARRTGSD